MLIKCLDVMQDESFVTTENDPTGIDQTELSSIEVTSAFLVGEDVSGQL